MFEKIIENHVIFQEPKSYTTQDEDGHVLPLEEPQPHSHPQPFIVDWPQIILTDASLTSLDEVKWGQPPGTRACKRIIRESIY